jgi:hypothetical protein
MRAKKPEKPQKNAKNAEKMKKKTLCPLTKTSFHFYAYKR